MALNDRIALNLNDLPFGQLAPSQANRESWYPGKRPQDIKPGDATWDRHYRVPTSEEKSVDDEAPIEVERVRITKLGRNIVCDQTIAAPEAGTPVTVVIDDPASWGAGTPPEYEITPTETQDVDGEQERTAGYDWAKGA
jgi:hypothetical protein